MTGSSKTDQVRALREARLARRAKEPNPFEDAARGRDPVRVGVSLHPGRPKRKGPPPWEVLGLSQRTYYRRLAAKKAGLQRPVKAAK